jgi:restriction system protein
LLFSRPGGLPPFAPFLMRHLPYKPGKPGCSVIPRANGCRVRMVRIMGEEPPAEDDINMRKLRVLQSLPYELQRDWDYVLEIEGIEGIPDYILRPGYGRSTSKNLSGSTDVVALVVSGLIIPEGKTEHGTLVKSYGNVWLEIVRLLGIDWSTAFQIPYDKWEELIAGAFKKDGYDEVTLTLRSGDYGRDVIAIRKGVGCVKVIGSVKAYSPRHLVRHDDVRALLGVMSGEQDTSKGILTTTSDFAPTIATDPFIKPFVPTRLELLNGEALQKWLIELAAK